MFVMIAVLHYKCQHYAFNVAFAIDVDNSSESKQLIYYEA